MIKVLLIPKIGSASEFFYAPTIIIANTRKGHGVSFWDNNPTSHGSWGPTEEQYNEAKIELEKRKNDIMNMEVDTNSNITIMEPETKLNFR